MYYEVKVQFENPDGKKSKSVYLVNAESVTESEARITKFLLNRGENQNAFEVKESKESKIHEVIEIWPDQQK